MARKRQGTAMRIMHSMLDLEIFNHDTTKGIIWSYLFIEQEHGTL